MKKNLTRHIPNAITCCNLLSGCVATVLALRGDYLHAFLFIIIGAVFDFFDGMSARLLRVSSPIGKELDSLADVVTFGVAPSAMVFTLLKSLCAQLPLTASSPFMLVVPYVAFLLAAFSALRLARFNLDERQAYSFIGLPTPANALFWGSLACKIGGQEMPSVNPIIMTATIIVAQLLFCWLLVSPLPMFSLKFRSSKWKENRTRYIFLFGCPILMNFLGIGSFAAIIGWYIALSLIDHQISKPSVPNPEA